MGSIISHIYDKIEEHGSLDNYLKSMEPPIKIPIKANQNWLMRNGQTVRINEVLENEVFPVRDSDERCWQANGKYWRDGYDHGKDLVQLIS